MSRNFSRWLLNCIFGIPVRGIVITTETNRTLGATTWEGDEATERRSPALVRPAGSESFNRSKLEEILKKFCGRKKEEPNLGAVEKKSIRNSEALLEYQSRTS
ncbi:hypothetical protein SAY86_022335 [Trapa natans]|uniref:Uncharacterized protein n=1 Tax=Trapa natans TaxID=22666 RepID=A0AAN7R8B1_TRANT|nr:hypothetical protein SAY86_022335 [Trapa natans]